MQLRDKKYITRLISKIQESVTTVNAKILAHRDGAATIESVLATVGLEQLAMQQEILLLLSILVAEPGPTPQPAPDEPKKLIGFTDSK